MVERRAHGELKGYRGVCAGVCASMCVSSHMRMWVYVWIHLYACICWPKYMYGMFILVREYIQRRETSFVNKHLFNIQSRLLALLFLSSLVAFLFHTNPERAWSLHTFPLYASIPSPHGWSRLPLASAHIFPTPYFNLSSPHSLPLEIKT